MPETEDTNRLKLTWTEGKYGGATATVGGGLIQLSVYWETVSKGQPTGYRWMANQLKSKNRYSDITTAKLHAESYVRRTAAKIVLEIGNWE